MSRLCVVWERGKTIYFEPVKNTKIKQSTELYQAVKCYTQSNTNSDKQVNG